MTARQQVSLSCSAQQPWRQRHIAPMMIRHDMCRSPPSSSRLSILSAAMVDLLLLTYLLHMAAAYPDSVDMRACEGHPSEEETREHHWSIYEPDVRTAFQVYVPDMYGDLQLLEGSLCAGVTHTIMVAYMASNGAPEKRRALLTATQGRLLGPGKMPVARGYHADSRCSARLYLGPHSVSSVSSIINDADLPTSYTVILEVRVGSIMDPSTYSNRCRAMLQGVY